MKYLALELPSPVRNLKIKEDLGKDIVEAAQWVEREKTEAVWALGRFLDKTKELMFETVITCECRKLKEE